MQKGGKKDPEGPTKCTKILALKNLVNIIEKALKEKQKLLFMTYKEAGREPEGKRKTMQSRFQ